MVNSVNRRGFTLIELLVVIAIIGILSSVVLGQLNESRAKSADAAVKSNLNNMRAQAELIMDASATNSYAGVCVDSRISAMRVAAIAAGGNGGACNNNVGFWVAWAGLKGNPANAWCVDNTGTSRSIPKPAGAINSCP